VVSAPKLSDKTGSACAVLAAQEDAALAGRAYECESIAHAEIFSSLLCRYF